MMKEKDQSKQGASSVASRHPEKVDIEIKENHDSEPITVFALTSLMFLACKIIIPLRIQVVKRTTASNSARRSRA